MKEQSTGERSIVADGRHRRRNAATAIALFGIVLSMSFLAFNSLPLYRLFSRLTGYDGTTQVAETIPTQADGGGVVVRFDVNVATDMPWQFTAPAPIQVRLGKESTVSFTVTNVGKEPTLGRTTYNVTPFKAGAYFNTIRCFCFSDHVLMPGEHKQLSVTFFVDPKMATDPNAHNVSTITLAFNYFNISNAFFKERSAVGDPRAGITK